MGISRLSVKSALLIAAVSALGQTQSQKPAFLSDYLALHPWDAAKFGPMVVVSPERTSVRSSGTSLSAFDRKLIRVGSLTAIAPTEMVLIDDSLREPPNMYDGLPTNAKVLYLLSTLTEDQLKTANANGIGLKDLQGEQQKVFRSLLPTVLSWGTYKVGEVGAIPGEKVDGGSVPDDQMDQVKVKIQSGISFEFKLLDQPNSYTGFSNRDWYGKPGDKVKVRTESDKDRRAHAFGLDPRRIVPNESKPSQLNYADPRLAAQLLLPGQSTVKGLLKDASAASGFEITADLRVRDLMVETFGARVKAGDLLKAIALCVTGTYRKVDSAFVLTSDIAGLGARKLKFCAWKESVDKELQRREGFWRERVFKSGALGKIGFDPNDPLAPDERTMDTLNRVNDRIYGDGMVGFSSLTPAMRNYVTQVANNRPGTQYGLDRVGLHSETQYSFVLPNGDVLHQEDSIGPHTWFSIPPGPATEREVKLERFPPVEPSKHHLIVKAESSEAVASAMACVARFGFTDLWLETHSSAVLEFALKQRLGVRLVIRPWAADPPALSLFQDANVLGDIGSQLAARRDSEPDWITYKKQSDLAGIGPPAIYDMTCPLDRSLSLRWTTLAALAHTPGLTGIVVLDSEPAGYEPSNTHVGSYSPWLSVLNEFGYSESQRLDFLREQGVDPIDIASTHINVGCDLNQPFFLDEALGQMSTPDEKPYPAMRGIEEEWTTYRAKLNADRFRAMTDRLVDVSVPILMMPRSVAVHTSPRLGLYLVPWIPGEPIPTYDPQSQAFVSNWVYTFNEESSPVAIHDLGMWLKSAKMSVAVDTSSVKPEKLDSLLGKWFPRVHSQL